MQTRTKLFGAALLMAGIVAFVVGCEDTDIVAPEGSTITVVASPAAVFIDQDAGETQGTTTITAQVVDSGGFPLKGIKLFFTTDGGILNSAGETVETNNNGIVADKLTLRLIQDPDAVVVTVQSTNLVGRVDVAKSINLGPIDPVAVITASPPVNQNTNKPIVFDGANSTFDPLVNLTCFEWKINSNFNPSDELFRDAFNASIDREYSVDQDLSVTLRVSDDPTVVCNNTQSPDPAKMSIFTDSITYQIRCDFTPPVVDAGPNVTIPLLGQPSVTVSLTATASDAEDFILAFKWDCGNGSQNSVPGQSVGCTYNAPGGQFTATVTVENDCGLITTDSLVVNVTS